MTMNREDLPAWAKWVNEWEVKVDGSSGYLMTVAEFNEACEDGAFIDYDGMADTIIDGKISTPEKKGWFPDWIYPSTRDRIPPETTHVLWYNR